MIYGHDEYEYVVCVSNSGSLGLKLHLISVEGVPIECSGAIRQFPSCCKQVYVVSAAITEASPALLVERHSSGNPNLSGEADYAAAAIRNGIRRTPPVWDDACLTCTGRAVLVYAFFPHRCFDIIFIALPHSKPSQPC